jgi:phosphopantetheine adenylyltransferase
MENNIKFEAHLTLNHQLLAADKLISNLRQQHAADEEYIKELEEMNEKLRSEIEEVKKQAAEEIEKEKAARIKICNKYSTDVAEFLKTDELYAKYKKQIEELKEERDRFRQQRDNLVYKVIQMDDAK